MDQESTKPSLPDPFSYVDYRAFLRAWFDAKKALNPRYSHRAFVRRTGQKSPSLLADVIAGRRNLTATGLDGFVRALALSSSKETYFRDLVHLDQAATADERAEILDRILAARHFRQARTLEGASLRYLTHWSYPAVHELAGCAGFKADPKWIAKQLDPRISVAQAREALEVLQELGLLVRSDEGALVQGDGSLVTPHQMQSLASFVYHRGMLARADNALALFRARERHFCGLTVSVPEAMIPKLKRELDQLQERLLSQCDAADNADRVLQINLQLFPLTHPVTPETP